MGWINFAIAGHKIRAAEKPKLRWFIYLEEDIACTAVHFNMLGPTTSSQCNSGQSNGTGLEKHFKAGCSNDTGSGKSHIRVTLLEHMDTTVERLEVANHVAGDCICTECGRLKDLEDKSILRLGSLHGPFGLNTKDEMQAKSRVQY